ncbi:DUF5688 family protein [Mediterraneibacter faecis]|uniref:DUF5688 family protein n=1 Tax=Mediterraneibacter faecis TaxID=592978 RepID=UPI001D09887D|nr:DUF5688 family protein [Mediterraneibacter faecis]MCB5890896.1 DUF5688 family protein [Lachnospiraceae bacterium 210521-DFI.4.71]MCB7113930.1 DUF5688 family protein [Mediterraneibacter faecis]MCB7117463.1 DUF5688 family protein [Mediterraneibacter faecis]MCB7290001.1 DUF5688 family protein [Mediterraneibacter faecis]MCB7425415.1 DUF5688 family protein [Mediterraneibacter faecis]
MKKEEFIQFVAKNIKYHLPSEFKDFKIEVGKHMGLVISEKKSPNTIKIYLDESYEKFMENKNIFPVMETVANNITQGWHTVGKIRDEKRQAIEFVNNYAEVKKHLQFVLRDPDFTEIPMNQIKTELGSYVALYEINMDKNDAEHISIPITDKLTKRWGITADQLYQDTIKVQAAWNQPLLADLLEMGAYLNGGTRPDNLLSADKIDDTGLYVLTNYKLYNGAAMIVHDEMAQKIGNLLQMDYYILPSTVHELLVYPDNGVISITQLQAELFSKVRSGQVRFLFGSTAKMGAGTNVQDRLIALHHLDVPWKPSDIEQQEGRILRQGNQNEKVQIFRYVTEGTFDSYMWQLLENKQKFVGQIMTSKSPVRSCEDVDEAVLSFAEIKALATGNPYIKEKMELDIEVAKLKVLKANHNANRYRLENQIVHDYPLKISNEKVRIQQLQEDLKCYQSYQMKNQDRFEMIIENVTFDDKELAGKAIRTAAKKENRLGESVEIGTYQGFTMFVSYNHISNSYNLKLQNQRSYLIELGENGLGNIIRINNALDNIPKHIARAKQNLQTYESQLEDAKIEVMKEFPKEADLKEKTDRLSELNALLNMDQSNHEIVAEEQIEEQETEEVTNKTQRNEVVPKFGTR